MLVFGIRNNIPHFRQSAMNNLYSDQACIYIYTMGILPLTRKALETDKGPLSLDTWHSWHTVLHVFLSLSECCSMLPIVSTTTWWGTKSPVSTSVPFLVHVAYVRGPPVEVQVNLKMGIVGLLVSVIQTEFPNYLWNICTHTASNVSMNFYTYTYSSSLRSGPCSGIIAIS